jgi:hypothetical protein
VSELHGAPATQAGLSQAEPKVSALRASIPSVEADEGWQCGHCLRPWTTAQQASACCWRAKADFRERMYAVLNRSPQGQFWRPIDTAPDTECEFLAWDGFSVFVAYWYGQHRFAETAIGQSARPHTSHWMPLPEPPQGTEAGTAETEGLGPTDDGPVAASDAPQSGTRVRAAKQGRG